MNNKPDVEIVSIEQIEVISYRQRVAFARYTYFFAAGLILPFAIMALVVICAAWFTGHEPPNWAVALESSIVTGSLAVIFKDHLPPTHSGPVRRGP